VSASTLLSSTLPEQLLLQIHIFDQQSQVFLLMESHHSSSLEYAPNLVFATRQPNLNSEQLTTHEATLPRIEIAWPCPFVEKAMGEVVAFSL